MEFLCPRCRSVVEPLLRSCPSCREPVTEFLRRHSEEPLDGKYRVVSLLGVGGMGEVYKAEHVHLHATRVIKLMRPSIDGELEAHDRFVREARLATLIQHPNVAALFDFSTLPDGTWYMVWEYIEGVTLLQFVRQRGRLEPDLAVPLAIQALHGLDAIHRAGIVHRDVSPENLMVTTDGSGALRLKIIDLGVAKQWNEATEERTKTGMFVGKLKYSSPEQLGMLPEGEQIDARADLYSFGLVLYEMLAGAPAYQAETPHQYVMMHLTHQPRPLRQVIAGSTVGQEIETAIFRSLEKERNRRFGSALEFARALESASGESSTAPAMPAAPPIARTIAAPISRTPFPSPLRKEDSKGGFTRPGSTGSSTIPRRADADAMLARRRELLDQIAAALADENFQQADVAFQTLRMHLGMRAEGDPEFKRMGRELESRATEKRELIMAEIERGKDLGKPKEVASLLAEMDQRLGKRFGDSTYRLEVAQWLRTRADLFERVRAAIRAETFASARELLSDLSGHLGQAASCDEEYLALLQGYERAVDETTSRLARSIQQARDEDDAVKAKRVLSLYESKLGADAPRDPMIEAVAKWVRDPNRQARERKGATEAREAARRATSRRRRTRVALIAVLALLVAAVVFWRSEIESVLQPLLERTIAAVANS